MTTRRYSKEQLLDIRDHVAEAPSAPPFVNSDACLATHAGATDSAIARKPARQHPPAHGRSDEKKFSSYEAEAAGDLDDDEGDGYIGDDNFDAHEEPLTHAEVWDDSALIDAWEEAQREYKEHHSMTAKKKGKGTKSNSSTDTSKAHGENRTEDSRDVGESAPGRSSFSLKSANDQGRTPSQLATLLATPTPTSNSASAHAAHPMVSSSPKLPDLAADTRMEDAENRSVADASTDAHGFQQHDATNTDDSNYYTHYGHHYPGFPPVVPPMPAAGQGGAIPNIDDENLSNLLMSWYFAGYYTGLYQGKRSS